MATAIFIITSNNKTPQSLSRHSCLHLLWHRNNGGLISDVLSEPDEPVHQIELNRLKRFAFPVSTNPQIT